MQSAARRWIGVAIAVGLLHGCQSAPPPMSLDEAKKITANFAGQGFIPPPRTTVDVTTILDQAKPDLRALAARRAIADAPTPASATALFYYERGQTRGFEGRIIEAIADLTEAVHLSQEQRGLGLEQAFYLRRLGDVLWQGGYLIESEQAYARAKSSAKNPVGSVWASVRLSGLHASLGDFIQADADLHEARRLYDNLKFKDDYAHAFLSAIEAAQGDLFLYRGDYSAAEKSFLSSMADADWLVANWNPASVPTGAQKEVNIAGSIRQKERVAEVYSLRGMLSEAEYWNRRALFQSIEMLGVNAPPTISALMTMSSILAEQGRYAEAQKLAEITLSTARADNPRAGSTVVAEILLKIGTAAIAQAKTREALDAFTAAGTEIASSPSLSKRLLGINLDYAIALRADGRVDDALRIAEAAVEWRTSALGLGSPSVALARGFLASFLAATGENERALAEFQAVLPQLISLSQSAFAGVP